MKHTILALTYFFLISVAQAETDCRFAAFDSALEIAKRWTHSKIQPISSLNLVDLGDPGGVTDCCWKRSLISFDDKKTGVTVAKFLVVGGADYFEYHRGECSFSAKLKFPILPDVLDQTECEDDAKEIASTLVDPLAEIFPITSVEPYSHLYQVKVEGKNKGTISLSAVGCALESIGTRK